MSNIILASSSPRRIELLKRIVTDFEIKPAKIDEALRTGETAIQATERLATEKARTSYQSGSTTLGSDTLGEIDGEILGKPRDKDEAREMLFRLSGQTHRVVTAWCVKTDEREVVGHDIAEVTFRLIAFAEIESYLAMTDPTSYAAGYAIQGAGKDFIQQVDGDLETVIGLPTKQIQKLLSNHLG